MPQIIDSKMKAWYGLVQQLMMYNNNNHYHLKETLSNLHTIYTTSSTARVNIIHQVNDKSNGCGLVITIISEIRPIHLDC